MEQDYLSRHNRNNNRKINPDKTLAEEYENFLAHHAIPKAMTMNEMQDATLADKMLQILLISLRKIRGTN